MMRAYMRVPERREWRKKKETVVKLMFWGLFVVGLGLCTSFGIGKTLERTGGNWLSPPMLIGMTVGVAILALAGAFAFGVRPQFLPTDRSMVIALGALMATKVGVAVVHGVTVAVR